MSPGLNSFSVPIPITEANDEEEEDNDEDDEDNSEADSPFPRLLHWPVHGWRRCQVQTVKQMSFMC